jgi:hypothetical protein
MIAGALGNQPRPGGAAAPTIPCPKCQTPAPAGSKFCASCGSPLQAAPALCAKCNAPLAPGSKFCGSCGEPVP